MDPSQGPFECDHCTYFRGPSSCSQPQVVNEQQGQVDAKGCCNYYQPVGAQAGGGPSGMPPMSLAGLKGVM